MNNPYFFRDNIIAEPLINQWYAHPLLIAPATSAMLIANSHLPILQSYIDNPELHELALTQPEMVGGPFIGLKHRNQQWATELLNTIKVNCSHKIEFAAAIKQLITLLKQEAQGRSLEPLYCMIPSMLQGYIELFYNLTGQADFRLLESMLYKSNHYLADCQSVNLTLCSEDFRTFSLSSPRFLEKGTISVQLPFHNDFFNNLFSARQTAIDKKLISDLYEQIPQNSFNSYEQFLQFFTTSESTSCLNEKNLTPQNSDAIQIRYVGHACLIIEANGITIMTDPVLSYRFKHCSSRFTYTDLPKKIDYLLITHNHQDHVLIEHLLQLRGRVDTVVVPRCGAGSLIDPSLKLLFKQLGFLKVIDVDDMDTISLTNGQITAIPFLGEHGDFNIRTKTTYAIQMNGKQILCIADSVALDEQLYQHVHQIIGDVNAIFLSMECDGAAPTWLYGALLPEPMPRSVALSRKLNASDCNSALTMINIFNCKNVYLYAMGQEPWLNYIMNVKYAEDSIPMIEIEKLKQACKSKNINCEILNNYKNIII